MTSRAICTLGLLAAGASARPSTPALLLFAVLAVAGLVSALFIPRRRMWVKASVDGRLLTLEYAGLARGDDPALDDAVAQFARTHQASVDAGAAVPASGNPAPDTRK